VANSASRPRIHVVVSLHLGHTTVVDALSPPASKFLGRSCGNRKKKLSRCEYYAKDIDMSYFYAFQAESVVTAEVLGLTSVGIVKVKTDAATFKIINFRYCCCHREKCLQ